MTARSSRSDAFSGPLAPSDAQPQGIGRATETPDQNALERRAADARRRLVQRTETQARAIVHLHQRAETARLELDPETQALKREWEENEWKDRWYRGAVRAGGSSNGARRQCGGCRKPLAHGEWQCTNCGYADGAGYLPVPPKVSIYERWK